MMQGHGNGIENQLVKPHRVERQTQISKYKEAGEETA